MMDNNIMVSICCITYNHEKYIEEAIKSFLMQKVKFKFEILIHDDASTDNTANIIKKYEKKYPDLIKTIYQKENQYSKGIKISKILYEKAQGKYIAICEGDDYWTDPYKLQKQINYMESNSKCGLCFHTVGIFDDKLKKNIGVIKPYENNQIAPIKDVILGGGEFMGTNSIVFRRKNILDFPKFYLQAPVGDYPLQILLSSKEYAYFIIEEMSVYRINTGISWTDKNKGYENKKLLSIKLIKMLEEFDKYSKFKYKEIIWKKIEMISYENIIHHYNRKIDLSREEYNNFFKRLRLRRKIKMYFKFLIRN